MQIINIVIETIPSLNILPDGSMDPTKSQWRFGGTVYHVTTTEGPFQVQVEALTNGTKVFYDPCYAIHNTSLVELLKQSNEYDEGLREHYKTAQSSEHNSLSYLKDKEISEIL